MLHRGPDGDVHRSSMGTSLGCPPDVILPSGISYGEFLCKQTTSKKDLGYHNG